MAKSASTTARFRELAPSRAVRKKRGRPRKSQVERFRNGEIKADLGTGYLQHHRLAYTAPEASAELLALLSIPEDERTRGQQDHLIALTRATSRRPHLSHPVGIAYEQKLFCWKDERYEEHDGVELVWAADRYANLHRAIWGPLVRDIEERTVEVYGREAFDLFVQVGPLRVPRLPASQWRQFVADDPRSGDTLSPEDYRKRRWRVQSRYWAARAALTAEGPPTVAIVEDVVLGGLEPPFLSMDSAIRGLPRNLAIRAAFVVGLTALAKNFGLRE